MFGTIGGPELILILVIALIVFGPRKLPDIGKSVGKMMAEFRRASNDFKRTIEEEVEAEKRQVPLPPPAETTAATTTDTGAIHPAPAPAVVTPPDTIAQGSSAPAEPDTELASDGNPRS